MNAQIELMRVWLVGVLALYKNSEVPAEIAQLSSRVLIPPQKESTASLLLWSPVAITLSRFPNDTLWCQGYPSNQPFLDVIHV